MLWEESEGRAAAGDGGGGVLYASVAAAGVPMVGDGPVVCPTLAPGPA